MRTPRQRRVKAKDESSRVSVSRAAFAHLKPVEFEGAEYPNYPAIADGYARAVISGKVEENEFIILAAKRYLAMREKAEWGEAEFYWSDAHAVEACAFIESLPQVAGAENEGDRLVLEPWQIWITCAIFGFRITIGNRSARWTNEALIDVARKNGKSSWTAGIDIYCFLYEQEVGSEIYLAATSRAQAAKVFGPIRQILNAEEELRIEHGLRITTKEVRRPDGGFVTTISAIGRKEDGHNPHVAHIDELHAVPSALHEVMGSSMGARANQLFLKTTTAGVFASGPAYEERKRAERILRGTEKADRAFCVIYTVPPELQKEPLTWRNVCLANPMVEAIPTLKAKLKDELEASKFDPRKRAEFITKRLNVYAQGAHHALSPEQWTSCRDEALKIEDFFGKKGWVGVDLSSHDDQTAVVILFELKDRIAVFAWHFLPEESPPMQDERMADELAEWSNADLGGWLELTPGPIVDYEKVQARIEWLCEKCDVEFVVFDRAHSAQMVSALQKKNIKAGMISTSGVDISDPTKDLIVRARHGRVAHNGNPVLAWNAANLCLKPGELWRPTKDRTMSHLKIDGMSAAVHANTARLGRLNVKMPAPAKAPFDPNRVVRAL